jgi:phosphoglycolate phosphatase
MRADLPLDGLLFDKDGTLLDFQATWGPATAIVALELARGNEQIYRELAATIGLDTERQRLRTDSPLISQCSADYCHVFAKAIGESPDPEFLARLDAMFDEASLKTFTPIGDPASLFATLATAGYRLGIATNDSQVGALNHSKRLGVFPLVDFHAGYDSGFGRKPDAGMVSAFAGAIGAAAHRVAIIGDSVHDLEAGRAAGALRIAVLTGPAPRETLAPHSDYIIPSIAELPALLAELALSPATMRR